MFSWFGSTGGPFVWVFPYDVREPRPGGIEGKQFSQIAIGVEPGSLVRQPLVLFHLSVALRRRLIIRHRDQVLSNQFCRYSFKIILSLLR